MSNKMLYGAKHSPLKCVTKMQNKLTRPQPALTTKMRPGDDDAAISYDHYEDLSYYRGVFKKMEDIPC